MTRALPKHLPRHLQSIVEDYCNSGCNNVNEIIETLDNNGRPEELNELNDDERTMVLNELKAIMSVYDQDN